MRLAGLLVLLAIALLVGFAALNWGALSAPTALSFGVASVQAPLGVILFGFALGFAAALLGYVALQRTAQLLEARRHAQELRAARELAESAEASRIRELAARMEAEFAALRRAIEESANGVSAAVGQVDDKLDRLR